MEFLETHTEIPPEMEKAPEALKAAHVRATDDYVACGLAWGCAQHLIAPFYKHESWFKKNGWTWHKENGEWRIARAHNIQAAA